MPSWVANAAALFLVTCAACLLALALLWRIGSWHISPARSLIVDEGLQIGSLAPEIAAHREDQDFHLSFGGSISFVMFGNSHCQPCRELVSIAAAHPVTRHMRLVYLGDTESIEMDSELLARWELYRFHDERATLRQWRVSVSPYFYVIDTQSRVIAKGIANKPEHLDRLLSLRPRGFDGFKTARVALGSLSRKE